MGIDSRLTFVAASCVLRRRKLDGRNRNDVMTFLGNPQKLLFCSAQAEPRNQIQKRVAMYRQADACRSPEWKYICKLQPHRYAAFGHVAFGFFNRVRAVMENTRR
jgi:hypothetical protein